MKGLRGINTKIYAFFKINILRQSDAAYASHESFIKTLTSEYIQNKQMIIT